MCARQLLFRVRVRPTVAKKNTSAQHLMGVCAYQYEYRPRLTALNNVSTVDADADDDADAGTGAPLLELCIIYGVPPQTTRHDTQNNDTHTTSRPLCLT